jgi:DNA-binding response OmpR family regulator
MRVLLIDDDPLILDSLAELLLEHGYDVSTADGGESGLVKFCQAIVDGAPFSAVVSDLGMPHLDGKEVVQRVRQIDPGTLTVLLTGFGERPEDPAQIAGRADRMVAKPVRIEELQQALGAMFGLK